MRLFEYEAKAILGGYGISVPRGINLEKGTSIPPFLFKFPCMLKAQVPTGGRGKAGGIVKANSLEEAEAKLDHLFSMTIGGYPVTSVLIEEALEAEAELYLSMILDRDQRCYSLMAGTSGGMDVEHAARGKPGSILRTRLSPLRGLSHFDVQSLASHLRLEAAALSPLLKTVHSCFLDQDAELIEINPLAFTKTGLVALDVKMILDDNAFFRHPVFQKLPPRGETAEEIEAHAAGMNYVSVGGDIGIIGNGAGLTMTTMDLVKEEGGHAANFLDLGAGARAEQFSNAMEFLLRNERVRGIFINIFGGMTRCEEVARGVVEAISISKSKKPIVVRLIGTNEAEGERILSDAGITRFQDPREAAKRIVSLVRSL